MALVFNPQTGQYEEDGKPGPSFNAQSAPEAPRTLDLANAVPLPRTVSTAPPVQPGSLRENLTGTRRGAAEPATPQVGARSSVIVDQGMGLAANLGGEPIVKDTSSTTRTRTVVGKEEKRLHGEEGKLTDDAIGIARQAGANKAERAGIEEAGATDSAKLHGRFQAEAEKATQDSDAAINAALQKHAEEFQKYKDMKPADYMSSLSTGQKALAGIGMILGAIGTGLTGQENKGLAVVKQAADEFHKRELEKIERQHNVASDAKENIGLARQSKQEKLASLKIKQAAMFDAAEAELRARLSKLGKSDAEIETNKAVQALKAERLKGLIQVEESTREHVSSTQNHINIEGGAGGKGGTGADKPLDKWNADEKKNEGFAQRMMTAHQQMEKFKYSPDDVETIRRATLIEQHAPKWTKAIADTVLGDVYQRLSPEGKKRFLAEQDFARANLRKESGAAIGLQEAQQEIEGVGERPGDTPDTLAMKRQQRAQKVYGVGIGTGRPSFWGKTLQPYIGGGEQPGQPAAPAAPAGGGGGGGVRQTRRLKDGTVVTGTLLPNGGFQVDG